MMNMQFKIQNLKSLLLSITKNKINKINIKSADLQLTVNTIKHKISIQNKRQTSNTFKRPQESNLNQNKDSKEIIARNQADTYFTIVSPMIGTFYRSPAPNESPFINISDKVVINQTVCIIEAMKLMNEIQSEVSGQIAEILVQDGDIVDCGQALMRVKH